MKILDGIADSLLFAWILSWFGASQGFVRVIQPFIKEIELTTDHYYFVFALIGAIGGLIMEFRG